MRRYAIASAAILIAMAPAGAIDDWDGSIKIEAGYKSAGVPFEVAVDLMYARPGADGLAWGTLRYGRPAERIYAHPICVGVFSQGQEISVSGRIVRIFGGTASWMTWEFDVAKKRIRVFPSSSEAEARAYCDKPSGSYPGLFEYGYLVVR